MKKLFKSLLSNRCGVAFVEFALFMPLILVMIFGAVEFTRYIIISQKVERSAYVLSNITSQFTPLKKEVAPTEISVKNLDEVVFAQFKKTMDAYNSDADRIAIISSITKTASGNSNNKININWQRAGGGTLSSPEAVSLLNGVNADTINSTKDENGTTTGTNPSFPSYKGQLMNGALSNMRVGENMIITEVFYKHTPLLHNLTLGISSVFMPTSGVLKSVTFSRPREGDTDTLKRPTDDGGAGDGGSSLKESCTTIKLVPPDILCKATRAIVGGVCKETKKCHICTDMQICKTCTTGVNAESNCLETRGTNVNCSDTISERDLDMSYCTGNGKPNPPPSGGGSTIPPS